MLGWRCLCCRPEADQALHSAPAMRMRSFRASCLLETGQHALHYTQYDVSRKRSFSLLIMSSYISWYATMAVSLATPCSGIMDVNLSYHSGFNQPSRS